MTNYEKIKNMTVEEMAHWLLFIDTECNYCIYKQQLRCEEKCSNWSAVSGNDVSDWDLAKLVEKE